MNITFRNARPEDVNAAVPLIYSSGPPAFEYGFKISDKKDAQAFLKYIFVRAGSEFSYTNHICVIDENQEVVGIGAAFSGYAVNGFTFSIIKFIFSYYGLWEGIKVIWRGLQIEKVIPPPKKNTEYLAHLGIQPNLRGLGLGTKMIQYFIERAKEKGRTTVSLDVSLENPKAQALYERIGFKVEKENVSTLKNQFSYVASHYKMRMML